MAVCCICGKEMDVFDFYVPFSTESMDQVICRDCYNAKMAIDNGRVELYAAAREYFVSHLHTGKMSPDMHKKLEEYIEKTDQQNESVLLYHEIQKKYDRYMNENGKAVGEKVRSFLLTTGNGFEGYRVKRYINLVSGETVLGTGFFTGWDTSISDTLGVESNTMENKVVEAKRSAQSKMIRMAIGSDANAVLGVSFDVTTLNNNMIVVSVNGTAVEVEKIEK